MIAPLSQLKDLYAEIKRNLDVNLEQSDCLQRFSDFVSVVSARHLSSSSQSDAAGPTQKSTNPEDLESPATEAPVTEEQQQTVELTAEEKFIY